MNDTIFAIAHSMALVARETVSVTETMPDGQVIRYATFAEFWYTEKLRERENLRRAIMAA